MTKKILIVDDAVFMRRHLKSILLELDCTVFEAENGKVACELFLQEHPDIVLLDISMPVMDGIDALIEMRKHNTRIPIIMCSAMGQESMIMRAIKEGATDFIVKPFTPAKILSRIRKLIEA